jgi:hypothetical protein
MSSEVVAVRFSDEERLLDAVRAARADGFGIVDAYTPYPVHGLDAAMGLPRSRLPLVAFGAGLAGVVCAIGFQFYIAAIDWPLNVGGKPLNSTLAYLPIAFEITVLLAGLIVTAAFLFRCRLFPGARPVALDEAATLDGFVLVLRAAADEDDALPSRWRTAEREEVLR